MRPNLTKRRLRQGGSAVGCFVRYPDAGIAELLALQGFDFLVLDAEHGTLQPHECENMVRAAELWDVTPIVRVPTIAPSAILRYLDTGAQGVQAPLVGSPQDAAAVVRAVKYAPSGNRGLAGVRAAAYGQRDRLGDYVAHSNAESLVVIQIETREAVDGVAEIAAIDGVDVIFVGPTDLSQALGVVGALRHPLAEAAYAVVAAATRDAGTALGVLVGDADAAARWRARGARYIAVTIEAVIARGARELLAALRSDP